MPGSLRLGKIAGINVYAHLSWFIILVLLTWSLANDWFAQLFPGWSTATYWIAAFISTLLLFVCVLAHEFAHALIARTSGLTVKHITLFIFGGVANMEEDMKRPGVEFRVAVAGPIASFCWLSSPSSSPCHCGEPIPPPKPFWTTWPWQISCWAPST